MVTRITPLYRKIEEAVARAAALKAAPPAPAQPRSLSRRVVRHRETVALMKLYRMAQRLAPGSGKRILAEVSANHGVGLNEIASSRRSAAVVAARHDAEYRMWRETDLSFPMIGKLVHKDHTGVLRGVQKRCRELGVPFGKEHRPPASAAASPVVLGEVLAEAARLALPSCSGPAADVLRAGIEAYEAVRKTDR